MVIQLLILSILLLIIPTFVGGIFAYVDNGRGKLLLWWISGQFLLWAGFEVICVPLILKRAPMIHVVVLFWAYIAAMCIFSLGALIRRRTRGAIEAPAVRGERKQASDIILWLIFLGILLFQLVQAVRLAYADGDDAYYVGVATTAADSGTMYFKFPYTGAPMDGVDVRHGLAPFPIWIAFLSRVSGMHTGTIAQVVLPVVLLSMTYGVFYLLGTKLFPERNGQLPLFLIFVELLVLFGDYSFSSVENFMIARSSQGKAVLGSLVIPFLFFLFFVLWSRIQEKKSIPRSFYMLLAMLATVSCLCSALGALLFCMAVGVIGVLGAVGYKRFGVLLPLALSCLPCICCAIVYLIWG